MKFAIAMILAAIAIVPAVADGGASKAARRRAKVVSMTPAEREAKRASAKAAERAEKTKSITAKFAAAKAACPGCYRVIVTNGVYVALTKPQYEAYEREKAEAAKREREAMEASKQRKHTPGVRRADRSRKRKGKVNGR